MQHSKIRNLFLPFSLLIISLLLCACGSVDSPEDDPARIMNYPGLEWGMTPEEACTALALQEGNFTQAASNDIVTLTDIRTDAFDGTNALLTLNFQDNNGDGAATLYRIVIAYPQDTDMEAVKNALVKQYGDPAETKENRCTWNSTALHQDIMTQEEAKFLESQGSMASRTLTIPISTIAWTTNDYPGMTIDGSATQNAVYLSSSVSFYAKEDGFHPQMDAQ